MDRYLIYPQNVNLPNIIKIKTMLKPTEEINTLLFLDIILVQHKNYPIKKVPN